MAPHVTQFIAEVLHHLVDSAGGAAAERALVVAVLDECQRGFGISADVIAGGVDRANSFGPMGSGGLSQSVTRKIAQPARNAITDASKHADAGLILLRGVGDGQVDDEQRDGETDSGQGGATRDPAKRQAWRELAPSGRTA